MIGFVASDKMDKTRVVIVEKVLKHTKYAKPVKKKIRYKVHDEQNQSHLGDKVEIVIARPMSREKRWRISGIVEKAKTDLDKGEAA
jgi:small subunit ribosomal protein S17